jgi:signal transduction histidine kinase
MEQVFGNLVCNAIKYSPRGGAVTISLRHEAGEAIVEVIDYGNGIAPANLERIFEPFCRGGLSDVPGAGLGLSVARKIVEAHHGSLEARSVVGLGSTFRVRLPAPSMVDQPESGLHRSPPGTAV